MANRTLRALGALIATAGLVTALAACSTNSPAPAGDASTDPNAIAAGELGSPERPVKFGVVGASEVYWETYEKVVADAGISVEIIDFTDYNQPNPALSQGELDINQFQHIIYLADYNVNAGDDLQPIGATAIYPLGLYSNKYDSPAAIPDGETVVVPNDTTNQARGLLVLQANGLIKLKDGGKTSSTVDDVIESESRVKVLAVDAALTVGALNDAAASIINNDFLGDAGITAEDAIAKDDPADPTAFPYINIFVTTKANVDNPVLNKLVELYQNSKDVTDGVIAASGGTAELATNSAAELQKALADVEADLKG